MEARQKKQKKKQQDKKRKQRDRIQLGIDNPNDTIDLPSDGSLFALDTIKSDEALDAVAAAKETPDLDDIDESESEGLTVIYDIIMSMLCHIIL